MANRITLEEARRRREAARRLPLPRQRRPPPRPTRRSWRSCWPRARRTAS